ncbi:mfs transporter [Stemphylium lycopersici]|uniref:Mfs transporter n=1 Tax=Stemphylium lycopersici TaxID=183478 RepID=A0A364MS22_STELY|nr:mfs transporter [Stemphylium lycopersici]RAR01378.1 mfs transporter [Stemphylium lycopersici]RAR01585.1 mfs transporter [Stemphylium lycopersici]
MTSPATSRNAADRDEADSNATARPTSSEEQEQCNEYSQNAPRTEEDGEKKEKKPSKLKATWEKLGLDVPTLMMMGKAALPPTICLAMYQSTLLAQTYSTLGYLTAIISIISFCIMPRAKYIQTLIMNLLATCIGSALALLMVWTGVKARQHTTDPSAPPQRYNSSQSAVLAVWLFAHIYVVNALKAKFPQLAFPTILYAILVNIAATNGFLFQTVAQCESFVQRLLETFLTGFAIATGVSLFIFPVSCRKVVAKEFTGYIALLRGTLGAHRNYIHSLEDSDMFGQKYVPGEEGDTKKKEEKSKARPEVATIKKMTGSLQQLHGKLTADLPFAKREIAYGKLSPDDLESIFKKLRSLLLPVLGLASIMDLFERSAEINHWDGQEDEHDEALRKQTVKEWNEMFKFVHEPFNNIFQALDDGLAHVLVKLQLEKPPKKKGRNQDDAEAKGDSVKPGDAGFAEYLQKQSDAFFSKKEPTLRHWVETKGIKLRDDYFLSPSAIDEETLKLMPSVTTRKRDQRQLFMVLYIMFLLNSISRSTLEFVKFADEHDQATTKSKLIWPGARRFKKWAKSIFQSQDANSEDETTVAGTDRNGTTVYMGEAFKEKKDPEHLPPANAWEKFGNRIRGVANFFRSSESAFGFRAACATMSIAIIAFLHPTQQFFVEQRLVWALIMVAISMTPTAGQAIFQFILRILGTAVAMVIAWLIWYIPGQKTPGILVFLWFFVAIGFYIPLKRMDLVIVGIISVITITMIIGYELQVRKIGEQAATATTGQPAYAIYILGPYRLATVVGGLAVAFFWTVFPYPITEHSALRQKLGGALYLSANLYSIMHEQVMGRIRGELGGDEECDKDSPGYQLVKARNKVFAKQMLTLQGLKMHAGFVKWEFPLGGKFPREEYEKIIGYVENIVNYTALLGYSSQAFTHPSLNHQSADPNSPSSENNKDNNDNQHTAQWFNDFRRVISDAKVTSHEVTSLLAMLSSSITNAQPLPPYMHSPPGAQLSRKLEMVDPEILSLKHISEPGYAAFAVMSISTRCIHMDVERLLKAVKGLVGELDFSFHVVSTRENGVVGSDETLVKRSISRKMD